MSATSSSTALLTAADVRTRMVEALELDLIGPRPGLGDSGELLSQAPAKWYLTGFLVPRDAAPEQRIDPESSDDLDGTPDRHGDDDDPTPERTTARERYLPSSMGLSVLVPAGVQRLAVAVRWGDYARKMMGSAETWQRYDRFATVAIDLPDELPSPTETPVPASNGLLLALLVRKVGTSAPEAGLPAGARTVSLFLVNARVPKSDSLRDESCTFQAELELHSESAFLARPDLRAFASDDPDDRIGDLQYRDAGEYAVGHNVATLATMNDGACRTVRTCWLPGAEIERVEPASIAEAQFGMDELAALATAAEAKAKLRPVVEQYRLWIERQAALVPATPAKRKATGDGLLQAARVAANRIEAGIELLNDADSLEAFRVANRAMALAARRRLGVMRGKPAESIQPAWRPFQLAFVLMNLAGIANPASDDRRIVDLLFFPTGGGKTEAYLGLAAFTLVLRRLRNPGIGSAGVSVLMRYTLRLLTLDQLSRAATLICALELERQKDESRLGQWPFEIGLWVGRAATPNRMGSKDDDHPDTARRKTIAFWNDSRKPAPIPLEECPWCGTKFVRESFRLLANGKPNREYPDDLRVGCNNMQCDFTGARELPIVAVDQPIYRRLPCFLIATVDKFALLPWNGPAGAFFGRVNRYDSRRGFYGPCDNGQGNPLPEGRLLPPDLIVQDELHLISGPLGTIAGLYETAIEKLCCRMVDGVEVLPKIVASTATVRRAEGQIRALFGRSLVDVFPPPGPNRRDSFFAVTRPSSEVNARLYVGVAAPGRSPKVAMLRVYLALLGAGQKWYARTGGKKRRGDNPADPYMTLVGYYNALRELGGARRLIEDEIRNRLPGYVLRKRVGEIEGLFDKRDIDYEPVELTSRENTARVAEAKRRLSQYFSEDGKVDVAIATNMISVGLDISRLGLMVVYGQPKTSAEYIQATSRVGREVERPGLVVTIMNMNKPRDRSHFERFQAYHESFYRSVEATSVTPFSPRALDKALAPAIVALARQDPPVMTPPAGASAISSELQALGSVVDVFGDRACEHDADLPQLERDRIRQDVRTRSQDLLDEWAKAKQTVGALQYNAYEAGAAVPLLRDFLDPDLRNLPAYHWKNKFRANRSMRDVEPVTGMWVKTLERFDVEED